MSRAGLKPARMDSRIRSHDGGTRQCAGGKGFVRQT